MTDKPWELTAGERNKAKSGEVDRQNQLGIAASNVDIDKAKEDAAQKKLLEHAEKQGYMAHEYPPHDERRIEWCDTCCFLKEFGL